MGIEIGILNWIQNLHTPAADAAMCFVTRLGDGGILWILLTVLLFLIPKTRKSGIIITPPPHYVWISSCATVF